MNKLIILTLALLFTVSSCKTQYVVYGPQGKIATKIRLPKGTDTDRDSVEMVVLMHGIFSSKGFPPVPKIGKELARRGTATIAVDFGGHGKSQGKKDKMVPLWCSKKYDGIYKDSHLHLVEGEVHTMHKKLDKTIDIIDNSMKQ